MARYLIWKRASLAQKFAAGSVALTLLTAIIIGGIGYGYFRDYTRSEVRQRLEEESRLISLQFAIHLNAALHNLKALADNSLVVNALADSSGRAAYLAPFMRDLQISETLDIDVGMFDFQGKLIVRSDTSVESDIGKEQVFQSAIKGSASANYHSHDGDQGYIAIAIPIIYPATEMAEGVLLARVEIDPIFELLGNEQVEVRVLSANGKIIGSTRWSENSEFLIHEQLLALDSPLSNAGLRLTVGQDKKQLSGPIAILGLELLLASIGILFLSVFISTLVGRRLAKPIVELSYAAQKISQEGNLDQKLPPVGLDEVGQLSASFREMINHVTTSYRTLEDKVAERTSELNEARLSIRDNAMRLEAILDNVADAIVTIDRDGIIQSANKAFERLFGYRPSDLIGEPMEILIPDHLRPAFQNRLEDYRSGKRLIEFDGRNEALGLRKDGTTVEIEFAIGELHLAGRSLLSAIIRDISERRRTERAKDEFISSVSHELRTPLTSIRGALGLLLSGRKEPLGERAASLVSIASKNCERLESLVNDILDMEKMENGTLEFSLNPVDVIKLVQQAIEVSAPYVVSHGKKVRFWAVEGSAVVQGDEGRLIQVMNNLLSNAAKYSHPTSAIDVFIARVGDRIRITVADHGPGIDTSVRKRMFTRFGQADSSDTRKIGGTGLGLSISKAILMQHGGTIGYRTRPGYGVSFYFELPLSPVGDTVTLSADKSFVAIGPQNHPSYGILATRVSDSGRIPVPLSTSDDAALRRVSGAFRRLNYRTTCNASNLALNLAQTEIDGRFAMFWLGTPVSEAPTHEKEPAFHG
ncbi:hypothetical protein Q669_31955 [Labrenzia sp. C1B10]|uniref:sensor histidine kinase n=1 Tax=unclassified Labrenzia TaxID=2648686 RepID=UPI0003B91914|nr:MULTISPECIES: ATP-binding protein [unclassified Labrenzia]ERP92518.1 hypothetical protein Q669_31955 [Labrenzia sp. C1B10]ERS04002.1 hypothetical protein Q675_30980 [Labrenzia sp. C1B70]